MKQKNHYYVLCIVAALSFTACNSTMEKAESKISQEDSLKIAFYDKYFSESDSLIGKSKFNQPVDPVLADECIANFDSIKTKIDVAKLNKMLRTKDVGFNFKELNSWLLDTLKGVEVDEIRIYFGAYTKKYRDIYLGSGSPNENRLTVFLWPYHDGKKARKSDAAKNDEFVAPFNIGNIHPNP